MFAQLGDLDLCRKRRQEETNVKKRSKDEEKTWQQHAPRTEKKISEKFRDSNASKTETSLPSRM